MLVFVKTLWFYTLHFCLTDGSLRLPETNIVFAISATGLEANETLGFVKEIVKSIIIKYGTERLEYSLIVYGESASPQVMFGDIFKSNAELITAVESVPAVSGVPSLDKALEESKLQFESPFIRPNAAKVIDTLFHLTCMSGVGR